MRSFCLFVIIYTLITNVESVTFNDKVESQDILCYQDTIDPCRILMKRIDDISYVRNNIESLFIKPDLLDDNCVLSLMDSIATRFIYTSNTEYLSILQLMSYHCDGEYSEYLGGVVAKIYYKNFTAFSDYFFVENHYGLSMYLDFELAIRITMFPESKWEEKRLDLWNFTLKELEKENADSCKIVKIKSYIMGLDLEEYR